MFSGEKEFTDDAEDTFINVGMPVNNKEKIFGLSTDESTYAAHTHCPYRKTSQKFSSPKMVSNYLDAVRRKLIINPVTL